MEPATNLPLPKDLEAALTEHAARGRMFWAEGALADAEAAFLRAWNTIPEPRIQYDFAQSISRGFVEFYRRTGQFTKAYDWLATMRAAYGDQDNPSVEFVAGMLAHDASNLEEAFRVFDILFKRFKARPFQGADPKYLKFYKSFSREPSDGRQT